MVKKTRLLGDIRCACGRLVARWEGTGVVIKCIRCGQLTSIPYSAIEGKPPKRI
jgi:phage FluMu protein Com